MSCELKFRVRDTLLNQWGNPKDFLYIDRNGLLFLSDSPGTSVVQQYTGLKDKNGKEIYEGDIVLETWESNNPYGYFPYDWNKEDRTIIVEYIAPSFNLKDEFSDGGQYCVQNFQREVLGNIFENPELVK